MPQHVTTILLWLFVMNLGIAFGAGLYEARVVVPAWKELPPRSWPNTGLLFWVYVTTIPLTLLTLANAIAAWVDDGPRRIWWVLAVGVTIVERLATFSYFIPTMLRLSSATDAPAAEVRAGLSRWLLVNNGRHLLTLVAWLAALKALTTPSP